MKNTKVLEIINQYMHENDLTIILNLKYDLEDEIRQEIVLNSGVKKSTLKVIEKLKPSRESLKGYHKVTFECKDYFGFVDGYRAFLLNNDLGMEKAISTIKLANAFPLMDDLTKVVIDVADVKTCVALQKAEDKKQIPIYRISVDGMTIGVNANYLLDMINAIGSNEVFVKSPHEAIRCNNADGEVGIVLPVKLKD